MRPWSTPCRAVRDRWRSPRSAGPRRADSVRPWRLLAGKLHGRPGAHFLEIQGSGVNLSADARNGDGRSATDRRSHSILRYKSLLKRLSRTLICLFFASRAILSRWSPLLFCLCGSDRVDIAGWSVRRAQLGCATCGQQSWVDGFTISRVRSLGAARRHHRRPGAEASEALARGDARDPLWTKEAEVK